MSLVCPLQSEHKCDYAGACNERALERHINENCRVGDRTRQPVLSDSDEEVLGDDHTGPAAGFGPGVSGHTGDGIPGGSKAAGQPALGVEQQWQQQQQQLLLQQQQQQQQQQEQQQQQQQQQELAIEQQQQMAAAATLLQRNRQMLADELYQQLHVQDNDSEHEEGDAEAGSHADGGAAVLLAHLRDAAAGLGIELDEQQTLLVCRQIEEAAIGEGRLHANTVLLLCSCSCSLACGMCWLPRI